MYEGALLGMLCMFMHNLITFGPYSTPGLVSKMAMATMIKYRELILLMITTCYPSFIRKKYKIDLIIKNDKRKKKN